MRALAFCSLSFDMQVQSLGAKFAVKLSPTRLKEKGVSYIALLILMALMSLSAVATLHVGIIIERRAAEQELLEIGREFRHALLSYTIVTPVGAKRYPTVLQDLLKDPRFAQTKRHLRKIYIDPISGKNEWGLLQSPDGSGISGVYSLSRAHPIKIGNFDAEFVQFNNKQSYQDWTFQIAH